jgi:hypothetical protein
MDSVMNDYTRVLESTEQHLQELKAGGVRFLTVESETLRQLQEKVQVMAAPPMPPALPTPSALSAQPETPETPAQDVETAMAALHARAVVCVKCPNLASSR